MNRQVNVKIDGLKIKLVNKITKYRIGTAFIPAEVGNLSYIQILFAHRFIF